MKAGSLYKGLNILRIDLAHAIILLSNNLEHKSEARICKYL